MELALKQKVAEVLQQQGFLLGEKAFSIKDSSRETTRSVHEIAKLERLSKHRDFILRNLELAQSYMVSGADIDVSKIRPKLKIVEKNSVNEKLFRWWNLTWWSLPYEPAYGRQMRYIVWDDYHNAPMGLIGLQSPILSWSVRDNYLRIKPDQRDFWVNQSLSAQRLGSLPPYNFILGGKLVASMMTTDTVRRAFARKYRDQKTVMKSRVLPARLLFITTTGAFGKSSVYERLKHDDDKVAIFIGMTQGNGTFHIPNELYQELIGYLTSIGVDTKRGYGGGPSKKMRLVNQGLKTLGFENGSQHGVRRAVYLFPLARNLNEVIENGRRPSWYFRSEKDVADFWKTRWAIPRATRNATYMNFKKEDYLHETLLAVG
jgi:hypothetical protein